MPKTKSKMISIRVSQDDYEALKQEYSSRGTRSVSAFAREALSHVIKLPRPKQADLETEVQLLDARITSLQHELSQLSRIVAEGLLAKVKD